MHTLHLLSILLCLAYTVISADTPPQTLKVSGMIYDFSNKNSGQPQAHPDFNSDTLNCPNPPVKGMVQTTLGSDQLPVYAPNGCVTSADTFYQWYRNTPNVNIGIPFDLEAQYDPVDKVYKFSDMEFFPIDGQGYGNDNNGHNFGFTFQVHSKFTYQKGQIFDFQGDDDVWVFVNNQLVIDLGGLHTPLSGTVYLDTLGLTVGETYNFDFFSAERHVTGSTLTFSTSIALAPNPPPSMLQTCPKTIVTYPGDNCPIPDLYCLRLFTAVGGPTTITSCSTFNYGNGDFELIVPGQKVFLASTPDGSRSCVFDELATLKVTSPSNQVRGANYISYESDCADKRYPNNQIPTATTAQSFDVTNLFGNEVGIFSIDLRLYNKYSPYSSTDAYICTGSSLSYQNSLEDDNLAVTQELSSNANGMSTNMVIGLTVVVSVIGTIIVLLIVALVGYIYVKKTSPPQSI